jgi:hypothetical protein
LTAPKFKAGDVVKCIRVDNSVHSHYRGKLTNGKEYTVIRGFISSGGDNLVAVKGDDGYNTEAFASRFTLVPVVPVGIVAGDIVKCINPGPYDLTANKFYLVTATSSGNPITGGDFVAMTDDNGHTIRSFASRFVFHSKSSRFNVPYAAKAQAEVEKARAERKATEVARKEKGKARASAQVVKKPLLFTSLTEEDVHAALSTYLRAKLPIGLRVVDMDKTTEGFKLTLGVPA